MIIIETASPDPQADTGDDYRIVTLETADQRRAAAELYRTVFGYDHPAYGLNPRLLAGIGVNGGSVVGALDRQDRLVGFAYGFLGTDGSTTYHYSQAAVVSAELQGKGLGRRLKFAQREIALGWGTTTMRWAYDPLLTRNAHFNLDVLGARGIDFTPELYGEPLTDRIVVEWDLTAEPVRSAPDGLPRSGSWGELIKDTDRLLLAVPSDIGALRRSDPDRAADLAEVVRQRLTGLFADGYQAVSCQAAGDTAFYSFQLGGSR